MGRDPSRRKRDWSVDRMPVILKPDHWQLWTEGPTDDALALVQTCDDTLVVDRTSIPWFKRNAAEAAGNLL